MQDNATALSKQFASLGNQFDEYARQGEKPRHIAVNLEASAPKAGRLLVAAIDAGAFPESRKSQNGGWWDRTAGRIPGGPLAVSNQISSDDDPDYLANVAKNFTSDQFFWCWFFAIGSWLVLSFPSRFRERAAAWDRKQAATDETGRPIGRDGETLRLRWSKDGKPLPDGFQPKTGRELAGCSGRLDGEIASSSDFYDESDWLAHQRVRCEVYADACRLLSDLLRPITESTGTQAAAKQRPPLTDLQHAVLEVIQNCPRGKGVTGREICAKLSKEGRNVIQSTLTRHVLPDLMRNYGVSNRPGVGYYVEK